MDTSTRMSKNLTKVSISEIDFKDNTFRNRFNLNSDDLIESLKQDGQQVPVELRKLNGKYQIICGFRRCNALRSMGAESVLAFIHSSDEDELKLFKISLIENLQRATLTDLEKIDACATLFKKGTSKKELANVYSVGIRTVENYIRISTKAPTILRNAIGDGILTIHQAYPLLSEENKIIEEAIEKAKLGNLSVNRAKRLANKRTKEAYRKPVNKFKRFKHGFNLYIRFRSDFDQTTQQDIKQSLLDAIGLIENNS